MGLRVPLRKLSCRSLEGGNMRLRVPLRKGLHLNHTNDMTVNPVWMSRFHGSRS